MLERVWTRVWLSAGSGGVESEECCGPSRGIVGVQLGAPSHSCGQLACPHPCIQSLQVGSHSPLPRGAGWRKGHRWAVGGVHLSWALRLKPGKVRGWDNRCPGLYWAQGDQQGSEVDPARQGVLWGAVGRNAPMARKRMGVGREAGSAYEDDRKGAAGPTPPESVPSSPEPQGPGSSQPPLRSLWATPGAFVPGGWGETGKNWLL